jgi:bacterioferritin-associated ferredoxin
MLRIRNSSSRIMAARIGGQGGMIVCVCNALRERDVKQAARAAGKSCPHAAYAHLGARVKCGQCIPFAREVVAAAACA